MAYFSELLGDNSVSDSFPSFSRNNDREDEYLENYLKQYEKLKKLSTEKNLERKLLEKCMKILQVGNFLYKNFFTKNCEKEHQKNPVSQKKRRYVNQLLEEKEKMNRVASQISKENRELEKEIINKKVQLKDYVKKRKKLWNKATRMHILASGKLSELEILDSSDLLESMDNVRQSTKERELKDLTNEITKKSSRIVVLSGILNNLILFSGIPWGTDKNLFEIIYCTGKILQIRFSVENHKQLKKIVDDTIHRLNSVKI